MSEYEDEIAEALARGPLWGEILLGEGQSIVYLKGVELIREDPDHTRTIRHSGEHMLDLP